MKRIAFLLVFSFPILVFAQGTTWTSVQEGPATDPETWGFLPGSDIRCWQLDITNLVIKHIVTVDCRSLSPVSGVNIEIHTGGMLIVNADLTVGNGSSLTMEAGSSLTIGDDLTLAGNITAGNNCSVVVGDAFTSSGNGLLQTGTGSSLLVGGVCTLNNNNLNGIYLGDQNTCVFNGQLRIMNNSRFSTGLNSTVVVNDGVDMDGEAGRLALNILEGTVVNVVGDFESSNGRTVVEGGAELRIDGDAVLKGSNRLALSVEEGGIVETGNLTLDGSAKAELIGSDLYVNGDLMLTGGEVLLAANQLSNVVVDGNMSLTGGGDILLSESVAEVKGSVGIPNGGSFIRLNLDSEMTVDGPVLLTGGDLIVNSGILTLNDDMTINNGGSSVVINDNGAINMEGNISVLNGSMDVNGGVLDVTGNLSITGGGRVVRIDENGKVGISGDVYVLSNGLLEVIYGELIVQSVETESGGVYSYTGGNMYVDNWTSKVIIYDQGKIAVLGNKNFANADEPVGDLTLGIGAHFEVQAFGVLLVYNNVVLDPVEMESQPWNYYFSTPYSLPNPAPVPLPVFVIMGGSTCDYWEGPFGTCRDGDSSLPVVLLAFNAAAQNDGVELTWSTASERDNDYFIIERSGNGLEYVDIGKVPGNGTTTENNGYQFTDHSPMSGMNYYRLVQTDYDGTSETFGPVTVRFGVFEEGLTMFPNPLQNDVLNLRISGMEVGRDATVRIADLNGRAVYSEARMIQRGGTDQIQVDVGGRLQAGIYIVQVVQGGNQFSERLVVTK